MNVIFCNIQFQYYEAIILHSFTLIHINIFLFKLHFYFAADTYLLYISCDFLGIV